MSIARWLDPVAVPAEPPPMELMSAETRELHMAIDAHAAATGVPYLHPTSPTVQLDLGSSASVIAWQEAKAECLFAGEQSWSELPQLYARYGTVETLGLIREIKALEHAAAVAVCDSGMQANAVAIDALWAAGAHAILCRQVYNKTRGYLEWMSARTGGAVTIVDDGDWDAMRAAVRPTTRLLFAETFTNPLVRAQDVPALVSLVRELRAVAPELKLVIDSTIATPWAFKTPLLEAGVDVVVASGTKALGGQDRDLWGYVATRDVMIGNAVMDLLAMRGGILDWRRAQAIAAALPGASAAHARRCATAAQLAAFLDVHPRIERVYHPSLIDHPDAAIVARDYVRTGSLLSFRVKDADEDATRKIADAIASTHVVRYALSFDGLTTKVNHHRTVSEYFTQEAVLKRNGFDRLVRIGVGMEAAEDVVAAVNWGVGCL